MGFSEFLIITTNKLNNSQQESNTISHKLTINILDLNCHISLYKKKKRKKKSIQLLTEDTLNIIATDYVYTCVLEVFLKENFIAC